MDRIECVVIGAGVIGLSIARALALEGKEVLIMEAEDTFGSHTSSRNSEVIHAGIYYPKGSLKEFKMIYSKLNAYDAHDSGLKGNLVCCREKTTLRLLRAS